MHLCQSRKSHVTQTMQMLILDVYCQQHPLPYLHTTGEQRLGNCAHSIRHSAIAQRVPLQVQLDPGL